MVIIIGRKSFSSEALHLGEVWRGWGACGALQHNTTTQHNTTQHKQNGFADMDGPGLTDNDGGDDDTLPPPPK